MFKLIELISYMRSVNALIVFVCMKTGVPALIFDAVIVIAVREAITFVGSAVDCFVKSEWNDTYADSVSCAVVN